MSPAVFGVVLRVTRVAAPEGPLPIIKRNFLRAHLRGCVYAQRHNARVDEGSGIDAHKIVRTLSHLVNLEALRAFQQVVDGDVAAPALQVAGGYAVFERGAVAASRFVVVFFRIAVVWRKMMCRCVASTHQPRVKTK